MPARRSQASLSLVVGQGCRDTSDEELVRSLVLGEVWAIAETWHRFAPMVLAMAERCLGSKSEAEDVCQEVFCTVLRRVKTLREPRSLRSFVYSFAVRAARTALRRRKLRGWLSFEEPDALVDLTSGTLDVESREALRRFYVLLDRLALRDRLVFILRRMESMTVDEIAAHLKISESTVKRSLIHATDRLTRWTNADPGLLELVSELREAR